MTDSKKNVLIAYFLDLKNSPRSYKQICALKDFCNITELSFGPSGYADEFFKVVVEKNISFARKLYCNGLMALGYANPQLARYQVENKQDFLKKKFDIIIVHDIAPCPLIFSLFPNTPIVIDLHEYLPLEHGSLMWRMREQRAVSALCREYLPRAVKCLAPSKLVAMEYEKQFGVRPIVTYNAPAAEDLLPSKTHENKINLVHHGACLPGRHIELMLELMDLLDQRFILNFYLVGEGEYFNNIKAITSKNNKIKWHDPVPMTEITKEISQYDVGLSMLPNTSFNHDATISNKFFEYIQARIIPAVWPSRGLVDIVKRYDVGLHANEFTIQSMAEMLNALSAEDIIKYKEKSHRVAKEITGEKSIEKIRNIALDILK